MKKDLKVMGDWEDAPEMEVVGDWEDSNDDATPPKNTFEEVKVFLPKEPTDTDITRRIVHGSPLGAVGSQAEGLLEQVKEIGISGLPAMPRTLEQQQKGEEAYQRGAKQYTESVSRDPSTAEIGGEILGGAATLPMKALTIPVEAGLEIARSQQENASPMETAVRGVLAPAGAGAGFLISKGMKVFKTRALTKELNRIANESGKRFDPATANLIKKAIAEKGDSEILNVLKERDIDPTDFLKRVASGEKEATELADQIAQEVANRAQQGVERTLREITAKQGAKSQEEVNKALEEGLQRIKEEGELSRRSLGLEETGEALKARKLRQMDVKDAMQAADTLVRDARSAASLAIQRADRASAEEASRIAQNELIPLGKQLRKDAAEMEKVALKDLYTQKIPNKYSREDADKFMVEITTIANNLEMGSGERQKLLDLAEVVRENMVRSDFMGDAWGSLLEFKHSDVMQRLRKAGGKNSFVHSQVNQTVRDFLYSREVGVPSADKANELYMEGYDISGVAKNMTRKNITGRGTMAAPGKAASVMTLPDSLEEIEALNIPEELKQPMRDLWNRKRQLAGEVAAQAKQAPEVQQAVGQVEQLKQSKKGMDIEEIERQAQLKDKKRGLKQEIIETKLTQREQDLRDATERKLEKIDLTQQSKAVQDAVNAMMRGDEPGELGRSAITLGTGIKSSDIDAVIKSKQTSGGVAQLQAAKQVDPSLLRGKILPEDIDTTIAGATMGISPETRKTVNAMLKNRTSVDLTANPGFLKQLGQVLGVGVSYFARVPLLGSGIISEVNRALKTPNAIDALTGVANILKKAEEQGIPLTDPTVSQNIKAYLGKIGTHESVKEGIRMGGRQIPAEGESK